MSGRSLSMSRLGDEQGKWLRLAPLPRISEWQHHWSNDKLI